MTTAFDRRLDAFSKRAAPDWSDFQLLDALGRLADPRFDPLRDPSLRPALDGVSGEHHQVGRGVGVPLEVLTRDLVAGTASAGGNTIGAPRIEPTNALRGFSVLADAGVTIVQTPRAPASRGSDGTPVMSLGLAGLPFVSTPATAAWLAAEGDAAAQSEPVFGLRQTAPKCVGVRASVSRKLLLQGGALADQMVRRDLLDAIGRAIDAGILAGTGADGQPAGVGTVSGTVAVSGTSLSFAALLDGIRQVLAAGARMSDLRFIVGTQAYEVLSGRERFAGAGPIIDAGQLAGIPVSVSPDAPTDALYLGAWPRVVMPLYGNVEVFTNPYVSPMSGTISLRVLVDLDVLVPHPGAFLKSTSIT